MKYLLISALLTACNFGIVEIEEEKKTCYDYNYNFDIMADTVTVESLPFDCSTKTVKAPIIHILDPLIK